LLFVIEIFYLFYIRNVHSTSLTWRAVRGTPVVWACVAGVTLAQVAVTYLPSLQAVFGTTGVPVAEGAMILGVGVVFLAIVEVEKQVRLGLGRRRRGAVTPRA
jgi:magnesium-transporting ATPase (P-type)